MSESEKPMIGPLEREQYDRLTDMMAACHRITHACDLIASPKTPNNLKAWLAGDMQSRLMELKAKATRLAEDPVWMLD
jgi:hypothetical protein|tara:strand:- start:2175 stop:2408 length:234 start_codon:yes stop_codon:yes gene_type:complete